MSDKLEAYRRGDQSLPAVNRLWPLYGAGFENLGREGKPIEVPMPEYGPDELLVRHDACGLCFSDIKVISQGQSHPRIFRDMQKEPVVLGHEVSMTVVGVGENLRDQYHVGDRFIVQADIHFKGVNYAYGYMIQGGLSQYGVIDRRILSGDHGNYLLPVQPQTGYAESALTEPWACVTAAYELKYRTGLKEGGTMWVVGAHGHALGAHSRAPLEGAHSRAPLQGGYTISAGFDAAGHPARLLLTDVPADFAAWLRERAAALGVQVAEVAVADVPAESVDDIVLLDPTADLIEAVSPKLAAHGVCAIMAEKPLDRKVSVDIGRVHYNRWVYVGTTSGDVARAYADVPVRSTLKPGGATWFVGAGGPMGRMHVQRAIQVADHPGIIVCTDVSDLRLGDLYETFAGEAAAKGIEFICLNPMNKEAYAAGMARFRESRGRTAMHPYFDDIIVLAPIPAVISDAATWLAPEGVMNVFAGVGRGTMAQIDLSDVYLKQARVIGHSASSIEDLRFMLFQAETGTLSPNRSVAAIGSLEAARDGLKAVQEQTFPGKVVIFPNIKYLPLTALPDLKEVLPSVYALLKNGREWTVEAENEFLRLMLE